MHSMCRYSARKQRSFDAPHRCWLQSDARTMAARNLRICEEAALLEGRTDTAHAEVEHALLAQQHLPPRRFQRVTDRCTGCMPATTEQWQFSHMKAAAYTGADYIREETCVTRTCCASRGMPSRESTSRLSCKKQTDAAKRYIQTSNVD